MHGNLMNIITPDTNQRRKRTRSTAILFILFFLSASLCSGSQEKEGTDMKEVTMRVKVVSLEGCTATPPTIVLIKETAREMNIRITLDHVVVRTPEEAQENRHIGSPTVQIEGLDIDPQARSIDQFGIT